MAKAKPDKFTRNWIIENALEEIGNYERGVLTLRGLHYRLVARGMTNTHQHYKRVVSAMIKARWDGRVPFETFSDHDRNMTCTTDSDETDVDDKASLAKRQVKAWMLNYSKNRWENQEYYPEVFIEKKALIGVFQSVCESYDIALGACKGYPSLTFLKQAQHRMTLASLRGQTPVILYFGDYDPSGEDIPRSIRSNLLDMGVRVEVRRILLLGEQVVEMGLPPAPAKRTDSRTAKWDGLGQVELDAVEPGTIQRYLTDAIADVFDQGVHHELMDTEDEERVEFRTQLKHYVDNLDLDQE